MDKLQQLLNMATSAAPKVSRESDVDKRFTVPDDDYVTVGNYLRESAEYLDIQYEDPDEDEGNTIVTFIHILHGVCESWKQRKIEEEGGSSKVTIPCGSHKSNEDFIKHGWLLEHVPGIKSDMRFGDIYSDIESDLHYVSLGFGATISYRDYCVCGEMLMVINGPTKEYALKALMDYKRCIQYTKPEDIPGTRTLGPWVPEIILADLDTMYGMDTVGHLDCVDKLKDFIFENYTDSYLFGDKVHDLIDEAKKSVSGLAPAEKDSEDLYYLKKEGIR